jgi:hypothetical protein
MTDSPPARLRLGMVGGARGAFIGETHRTAARLDDRYELVAGALSADPQRAIESCGHSGRGAGPPGDGAPHRTAARRQLQLHWYPMMRVARALIEAGELGAVRVVQVECALGWLSDPRSRKQAVGLAHRSRAIRPLLNRRRFRHPLLPPERVRSGSARGCARRRSTDQWSPGQRLEDHAHILFCYDNGAHGAMWV